jgi:hypothetical protein
MGSHSACVVTPTTSLSNIFGLGYDGTSTFVPLFSAFCSPLEQIRSEGTLEFTGLHWKLAHRIEMTQETHPVRELKFIYVYEKYRMWNVTPRIKAQVNWLRKEVKAIGK